MDNSFELSEQTTRLSRFMSGFCSRSLMRSDGLFQTSLVSHKLALITLSFVALRVCGHELFAHQDGITHSLSLRLDVRSSSRAHRSTKDKPTNRTNKTNDKPAGQAWTLHVFLSSSEQTFFGFLMVYSRAHRLSRSLSVAHSHSRSFLRTRQTDN